MRFIYFNKNYTKMMIHRSIFEPTQTRRTQWEGRMSNESVRERLKVDSVEKAARKMRSRWIGHVIRMNDNRLPKRMFC